jgi:guanylate kinase
MGSGELFIVSAPSGAGKTTLIRSVTNGQPSGVDRLHFAVSHTTRRPRPSEVEGRDYHFVDRETFDGMVAAGQFLEWATVHGNRYGTSLAEVLPRLLRGLDVLLDIDVQGAARILSGRDLALPAGTRVHSIFVLPPSFAALRQRLLQRESADPRDVAGRLEVAHREIEQVDRYDYVIVNRDAEEAIRVLSSIILDKRHCRVRMAGAVSSLLADFAQAEAAQASPALEDPGRLAEPSAVRRGAGR